jgi:ribosome-associated heat shock protein Hsp15
LNEQSIRIDKFLWFVRLAKTRSIARQMVEGGAIRIDKIRPGSAHCRVRIGQIITTVARGQIMAIRIESLPVRRGPAPEAESCYSLVATQDAIDANGSLA